MEPPPIRYVTTKDGFKIAYSDVGHGYPFVFCPWPFNNVTEMWRSEFGRPLLEALRRRFRLIQYDSRGQGASTRGLSDALEMDHYVTDLAAVVDQLGIERFAMYGAPFFSHVAARYAAANSERVEALVLGDVVQRVAFFAWADEAYQDLAGTDWETFLYAFAAAWSLEGAPMELNYWRDSITQQDCLHMMRVSEQSDISRLLPSLRMPVLVMNTRSVTAGAPEHPMAQAGRAIAAAVPDGRLILFDGFASFLYSKDGEPPAAAAIEEFVRQAVRAPVLDECVDAVAPLTARERDVLRLIAQGLSNQAIASELVLSVRTVERHISNIYPKIGARGRADATAYALRHGVD